MSDLGLRQMERRYVAGDVSVLATLNAARRRHDLPIIRTRIIHYLDAGHHHLIGRDGWLDARSWNYFWSSCGMANLGPRSTMNTRKKMLCHYTPDKEQVTCKTCLKCLRSPNFTEGAPALHLSVAVPGGTTRTQCGGKYGQSTEIANEVGCSVCMVATRGKQPRAHYDGLNARSRRRKRRRVMSLDL